MQENEPQKLDYLALPPQQQSRMNVPAAVSLGCGLGAIAFVIGVCGGLWPRLFPMTGTHAGLITGMLALSAIINGAMGALRAERDSGWYNAALFGYATGIFMATLSPIFFLL